MATIQIEFDELENLPQGWDWVPLEDLVIRPKSDIVDGPFGSNLKASEYKEEGITIARLQNIDRNQFIFKNIRFISPDKAKELYRHNFRPGDILITKLGGPLGKACIAPQKIVQGIIVADLVRVRIKNDHINRTYLTYAINSPFIVKQFEKHTKGTTRPRVNLGVIRKLPIPVAPRNEQNRIVAEIEKQFSRLDEAVENLKRVKVNLKRYKASVLKAAVEGRLTEQWRIEHPNLEPASKLLDRILTERRKKWEEAEFTKMKAQGKEPMNDKWKNKYKKPVTPKDEYLPKLPLGWVWAALDEICPLFVDSAHRTPKYSDKGFPALRPRDVVNGNLNLENSALVNQSEFNIQTTRHIPQSGDIVYSRELSYGWGVEVPEGVKLCLSQGMCLFRPSDQISTKYFLYNLNGPSGRSLAEKAATGSAHPHINLSDIKAYFFPIAPKEEQRVIVQELDNKISFLEKLESSSERLILRAERLWQSILKKAFSGRLVFQNPDDEPAWKLLDRIKDERKRQAAKIEDQRKKGGKAMTSKGKPKDKRDIILTLKEAKRPIRPEDLFKLAGYKPDEVDQFYSELKMADQNNAISQEKKKNGEVYLKVK